MEELLTILEHSHHLDKTRRIDLPLVCEGDLNVGDEPYSNLHGLLGDDSALRMQRVDYSATISNELWLVERVLMRS